MINGTTRTENHPSATKAQSMVMVAALMTAIAGFTGLIAKTVWLILTAG